MEFAGSYEPELILFEQDVEWFQPRLPRTRGHPDAQALVEFLPQVWRGLSFHDPPLSSIRSSLLIRSIHRTLHKMWIVRSSVLFPSRRARLGSAAM
jgi:hypothetical protein